MKSYPQPPSNQIKKSITTGFTGAFLMVLCCAVPLILIALGLYRLSYLYTLIQYQSWLWGATIFFLIVTMWTKSQNFKTRTLKRVYCCIAFLLLMLTAGLLFVSYTGQPNIYPPNFQQS